MSKPFNEDFLLSLLTIAFNENMSDFTFCIHKIVSTNEMTKKQNEPMRNNLGFMAAELGAVTERFHELKYCTAHAPMQSSQTVMSNFSLWINPSEHRNLYCSCLLAVYLLAEPI